jgi:hypothetical protein
MDQDFADRDDRLVDDPVQCRTYSSPVFQLVSR